VHRHKDIGLFVAGIQTLRHGDNADTGKTQLLEESHGVG
jgi:hypothetical protein